MFIWFKNIIENQNGILHTPSPGEKQIINLTNYLEQDQEYYFLDEPEKSLDNNFVNDVLVRKLNEKANQGKTIVIVTHNANLGIRTSPYLTIYRKIPDLESSENETFLGHAFIDKMSDIKKQEVNLFWTEVCEKILEGGSEAFNDRSNYYRK
ncbi:hypothetical protein [Spiroplasma ixodetis]|uniref:hypothetical protein n=1 Tax=Spiroplasma ixodetis TaxID=2141 RepID=UPI002576F1CC|nr:hypothetical protein [Spiroplasma ixodetis]WJG69379.1 hypothetical protein SIXOD_v1c02380 [Spiroplasma ixodetis Y32]